MFSLGYWAIQRFQPCTCTPSSLLQRRGMFRLAFLIKNLLGLTPRFPKRGFRNESVSTTPDSLLITDFHNNNKALLFSTSGKSDQITARYRRFGHKVVKVRLTLEGRRVPGQLGGDLDRLEITWPRCSKTYDARGIDLFLGWRDILLWAISRVYPL